MIFDRADYINQQVPIEKELKTLFRDNETSTIFEIGACEGKIALSIHVFFQIQKFMHLNLYLIILI